MHLSLKTIMILEDIPRAEASCYGPRCITGLAVMREEVEGSPFPTVDARGTSPS